MPIGIDRFEDADALEGPTTGERIVRFLFAHDDQAFTRGEIADAIDAPPETVGTNLTRLKDRGIVRHRQPYWAFAADSERAVDALRDRFGDHFVAELRSETDDGVIDRTVQEAPPHSGEDARTGRPRDAATPGVGDRGGTLDRPTGSAASVSESSHREAARDFFERVRNRLEPAVAALYLFGSVARNDESETSDVDVLAVIADDADYAAVDDRLLSVAFDVQLEHGVPVEVHSLRESEFEDRKSRGEPFVTSVLEEGESIA